MHLRLCLCEEITPLELKTRVVVITHRAELCKTTGTGRLVPLTLINGEIRVRGQRGQPLEADDLVEAGRQTLLLYPTSDSIPLTPELGDGRPVTLVVPDGNWRQARKVKSRVAALADVPRAHLPPGPPSRYRLRSHRDPRNVATFEAVARALGILEGEAVQAKLERVFDVMVERTLWTRGELPAEQVTGGIRPAPDAPSPSGRDG